MLIMIWRCVGNSTRQRIAPFGASTTLACGKSRVSGSQPQVNGHPSR